MEDNDLLLPEAEVARLADAIWLRIVGSHLDAVDLNLRAKLAIQERMRGSVVAPFGIDKLSTFETAAYLGGLKVDTLRDTAKRAALGLPKPYSIGRSLFWRRSELDEWVEQQRWKAEDARGRKRLAGHVC
jgi:predicted DNA-binding transcriptional regulator AlpA